MLLLRSLSLLVCSLCLFVGLHAQTPPHATGTLEGRVQNGVSGDYPNNARVSIKGTELVALTDESGTFRLAGVPAGPVTLRVRFAGLHRYGEPPFAPCWHCGAKG